ncbi:hypothetical protein [Azospirillum doebereinerae]
MASLTGSPIQFGFGLEDPGPVEGDTAVRPATGGDLEGDPGQERRCADGAGRQNVRAWRAWAR